MLVLLFSLMILTKSDQLMRIKATAAPTSIPDKADKAEFFSPCAKVSWVVARNRSILTLGVSCAVAAAAPKYERRCPAAPAALCRSS